MLGIEFDPERDDGGYYLYGRLMTFWAQQNHNFYLDYTGPKMTVKMEPEQALMFYLVYPQYTNLLQPV
jgi:hypothetical protein